MKEIFFVWKYNDIKVFLFVSISIAFHKKIIVYLLTPLLTVNKFNNLL